MNYRKLEKNGQKVSEIGFGTWGLGGNAYGEISEDEAVGLLEAAFERGVTFFDTSNIYGMGRSETLLGKAFSKNRDQVVFSSKVGMIDESGKQDFQVTSLQKSFSESLSRLNTDYIDVLFLHGPKIEDLKNEKCLDFLNELKSKKRIHSVGVSVNAPQDIIKIAEKFPSIDIVQLNLSLSDQRAVEYSVLDFCESNKIAVVARTPLGFGFLSDKKVELMNTNDHRNRFKSETIEKWKKASVLFQDFFKKQQDLKQYSFVQIALGFCLSHKAIVSVIPGIMNHEQLEENVKSKSIFSKQQLETIFKIYKEAGL
jgi:aryl-alcohol dehydrogenase-like predicted oxidoreductase